MQITTIGLDIAKDSICGPSQHHIDPRTSAQHRSSPIPSDHLDLVCDMLPAGIDVGEQLAEWLFVIYAGGPGCPDQPRRKLGTTVRHRSRLKFEFLTQVDCRRIAMFSKLPQRVEISFKHQLHLVDCRDNFCANLLRYSVVC